MALVRRWAAVIIVVVVGVSVLAPTATAADANPVPIDLGPFPTAQELVRQQYVDFLGREPSADELAADADAIASGQRRVNDLILGLVEHATTGAPGEATRMYKAFLERPPDAAGLRYWSARIRAGARLDLVGSSFASSSEFRSTYGTLSDAKFVSLVYRNVLDRVPDRSGSTYWLGFLTRRTRGTMMAQFSESSEFVRRTFTFAEVVIVYQGMLLHGPDQGQFGVVTDQEPGAMLGLVQYLFGFPEYAARFAPGVELRLPFAPTSWACPGTDEARVVATGDVNHDGRADVVALTSPTSGTGPVRLRVFLGGADGLTGASYDMAVPVGTTSLAVGDVTGDGRADVVAGGQSNDGSTAPPGRVYVFRQGVDGVLGAPVTYAGDAFYENSVTIADLDGDGRNDVLAMGGGAPGPTILYQDRAGALSGRQTLTAPAGRGMGAVADLNHDGRNDIVIITTAVDQPNATVLLQDPDGSFHISDALTQRENDHIDMVPLARSNVTGLAVADFTGDGNLDVVLANGENLPAGRIAIYPGRGDGTFGAETYRSTDEIAGAMRASDMNGDGLSDLVVSHGQEVFGVYLQRPGGGLGTEQTITGQRDPGPTEGAIAVADLTNDGKPDVVAAAHWGTCFTVTAQR